TTTTLKPTASPGLPPSSTSPPSTVRMLTAGGALTFVTAGTCTINADQEGNDSFAPAPQVTRSFTVDKAPQAIVFGALANRVLGSSASFDVSATGGGSGKAVVFSSNTPDACTLSGNTVTVKGAGICTI